MRNYLKKFAKVIKENRKTSNNKAIDYFKLLPNGLTLLDIGAAGGIEPRWDKVCEHLNYIGVEPDSRSNKELEKNDKFKNIKILNTFAWSQETEIEFNLCKKPILSSAYKPNREFLDQYPNAERFDIIKKEFIQAKPLFEDKHYQTFDFVKLDIQGGELNALKGLEKSLDNCLGMEIEVEFSEMYKSQPLFGDVHSFLSSKGFYFCDFVNLYRWERDSHNGFGRCIFSDGLWMKDLKNLDSNKTEDYLKYAAICSIYGKTEEAIHSLQLLGDASQSKFRKKLIEQLKQQKKERRNFNILRRLWNLYAPNSHIILME